MTRTAGRRATTALALVLAALALTGCGDSDPDTTRTDTGGLGSARSWDIDTPDGRTVTCVSWAAGYAGGVTCDWQSAR